MHAKSKVPMEDCKCKTARSDAWDFKQLDQNPPVPASTVLALFGTQVQATTPRSGTRLSEVPGKGTVSYCLFAMQEEALGGARSRLEDFEVGLDGVRSLVQLVSCYRCEWASGSRSHSKNWGPDMIARETTKNIPRYPIICKRPPCFAILRAWYCMRGLLPMSPRTRT